MPQYDHKLWTYQDVVERILDTFDCDPEGRDLRQAKEAVLQVNRDIGGWHDWQWYISTYDFDSVTPQSTGTIAYTASTKTVVLSSATWPSWALYGEMTIGTDNRRYEVASVTDSTTLVLTSGPTSDVAAGTAYSIFRTDYEVPTSLRKNIDLLDKKYPAAPWAVRYVPSKYVIFADRALYDRYASLEGSLPLDYYNEPEWFTIVRSSKYDSGYALRFANIPAATRPYTLSYWRDPRHLQYYRVEIPQLVVNGDGTATSSVFTSDHVGSMLRISANTEMPTSSIGEIKDDRVNLFEHQSVITAVNTGTNTATLDVAAPTAGTVAAIISDPVDIDNEYMLSGYMAAAEFNFIRRQRDSKVYPVYLANFQRELALAKEADEDFRVNRGNRIYGAF